MTQRFDPVAAEICEVARIIGETCRVVGTTKALKLEPIVVGPVGPVIPVEPV
jgi:hypothetical protein